jgi:hypothetical protein
MWLTKKGGARVQLAWSVEDHAVVDRKQSQKALTPKLMPDKQ